jgi:solute:Na+ symporter, SSS family
MQLGKLDIAVLCGYLFAITLMGIYFARRNTGTEEYFVGGRSFSGWVIGLSLVGTSISSITFLAYPGDAFKTAWLRFVPNLMLPVGILIAAYFFLPFFRRGRITSAYEFLEQRFGPSVRIYGAVAFIFGQIVRISMILYLLALVVHEITGLEVWTSIWLAGLFVAFYTIVGGIEAVVWTDVLQTVVLVAGGVACYWVIVDSLPGGLAQILEVAGEHNKLSFAELREGGLHPAPWTFSLHEKTVPMLLLIGLSAWLTEYSSNQNVVQRYCASGSTHEARKAMLICAAASVPVWAFYMFLGTSLYVFFLVFPSGTATEMLQGIRPAEGILPYFVIHFMPSGFTGLVVASVLAAAMSSLDSSINAVSTVWVVDIYRRHLKPGRSDRHYLKAAWIAASVTSFLMVAGAGILAHSPGKTLQDTATILASLLSAGMLGLYMLGFFTQKSGPASVWIAICCTALFTAWTIFSQQGWLPEPLGAPFDLYYTGLIGNLILFGVAYLLGHRLQKPWSTGRQI